MLGIALVAVGVGACSDESRASKPCYPAFPTVTPASAPAGSAVAVSSEGWAKCNRSRATKFALWLGVDAIQAFEHRGQRVATVRVDRTGRFSIPARIPATTTPGSWTVTIGRLPSDHEEHGCDDGGGCSVQPPNLTVTGPP